MRVKPSLIIRTFKENQSVFFTAKTLSIHRATVYRWVKRARSFHSQTFGLSTRKLYRKSTRPHTIYRALSKQDEINIVSLRTKKKYTAEKIQKKLGLSVSYKTVHRALIRYKLIGKYGYHRRPRFQNTIHMHARNTKEVGYLQMDVKLS